MSGKKSRQGGGEIVLQVGVGIFEKLILEGGNDLEGGENQP